MLNDDYTYEYRETFRLGRWTYWYQIVGRHGGVHLHISHWGDNPDDYTAGLEYHYRVPPDYMATKPPSHNQCFLLESPCWHDGTSMYAMDHYLPMHRSGNCKESIFLSMVNDANRAFSGQSVTVMQKLKEVSK